MLYSRNNLYNSITISNGYSNITSNWVCEALKLRLIPLIRLIFLTNIYLLNKQSRGPIKSQTKLRVKLMHSSSLNKWYLICNITTTTLLTDQYLLHRKDFINPSESYNWVRLNRILILFILAFSPSLIYVSCYIVVFRCKLSK